MFGLKVPLTRVGDTTDFDSVNTILSNSVYKGSSTEELPHDDKGKLFILELAGGRTYKCEYLNCNHNGHSTDDTGYGTDNEDSSTVLDHQVIEDKKNYGHINTIDFTRMDSIRKAKLKVKQINLQNFDQFDKSKKPGHLGRALCKELLGIVPGHFRAKLKSGCGQRLCVRGLVPHSHAAKYSNIHIGDCLRLVNGREVTWDNIDEVFLKLTAREEVTIVVQQVITKPPKVPILTKLRATGTDQDLVQLISGHSLNPQFDPQTTSQNAPYSVMFIDLQNLQSESENSEEDLVYHFPKTALTDFRGAFITLYHTLIDLSHTKVNRTTFEYNGEVFHVAYHKEENSLLLLIFKGSQVPKISVWKILSELVRLLRVLYDSVSGAFTTLENHSDLNSLFALFFHSIGISASTSLPSSRTIQSSLDTSLCCHIPYLLLLSDDQDTIDKLLNTWEAQDFSQMSNNYFGCRRAFTILGSCIFYKSWLLCNHLPKEDLIDVYLYLKYQCLLSLFCHDNIQQLVVWREVNSTRQMYDLGEEQIFGYTEPVDAKLIWLIVGNEHSIMCSLLEAKTGALKVNRKLRPDSVYIDQAKAVLMQINSLDLSQQCDKGINKIDIASKTDSWATECNQNDYPVTSSPKLDISNIVNKTRRLAGHGFIRKDSVRSDGSMESNSSAGSDKIKNKKGALFSEVQEEKYPELMYKKCDKVKLTSGTDNCLLHFLHFDKFEGVFISPEFEGSNHEIIKSFHQCCSQIKHMFDRYRYRRKSSSHYFCHNDTKIATVDDTTFSFMREEGILFVLPNTSPTGSTGYWVVGRQRSKEELYVCFQDGTPQNMVELAFRMGFGIKS